MVQLGIVEDTPRLLASFEVAKYLGVRRKQVAVWALTGRIRTFKTPGGHYRFLAEDVERLAGLTT